MARSAPRIDLSREEATQLRALLATGGTSAALRARIVLSAAAGATNKAIALELGTSPPTVGRWRERFWREGLAGLHDAPRPGRPADDSSVTAVLEKAAEPPPEGDGHWSVRRLARATGLPPSTVHRIWRTHRLRPELRHVRGLDIEITARRCRVVGLFLEPPDGLVVIALSSPGRSHRNGHDRAPLAPVDGEGAGALTSFLRRSTHAADGTALVVVSEGLEAATRTWVDEHGDAVLQRVDRVAWPTVAESWLVACASRPHRDPGPELAAAMQRATTSGPGGWLVEDWGQVGDVGSR